MSTYFSSFPTVEYNGSYITNITLRAKFIEASKRINLTFYPYTIREGERPDQIAFYYYDDPAFSWLVFLSNNIMDPYFEWPMSNDVMNKFLAKKYGSVYDSQQTITGYTNNWFNDDREITAAAYRALSKQHKKYWAPANAANTNKTYVRKRLALTSNTNTIITLTVDDATGFVVGERVAYINGATINSVGEVTLASGTTLMVQHVTGNWAPLSNYNIVGNTSETSAVLVSKTATHNAIPSDEASYWSAVTAYDEELKLNESRKNIMLVDKELKAQVVREMQSLMVGNV